jgi:hypothetical protein
MKKKVMKMLTSIIASSLALETERKILELALRLGYNETHFEVTSLVASTEVFAIP